MNGKYFVSLVSEVIVLPEDRREVTDKLLIASLSNLIRSLVPPKNTKMAVVSTLKKTDIREAYRHLLEEVFRVLTSGPMMNAAATLVQDFFAHHAKESPIQFLVTFWTSEGEISIPFFSFAFFSGLFTSLFLSLGTITIGFNQYLHLKLLSLLPTFKPLLDVFSQPSVVLKVEDNGIFFSFLLVFFFISFLSCLTFSRLPFLSSSQQPDLFT